MLNLLKIDLILNFYLLIPFILLILYFLLIFFPPLFFFVLYSRLKQFLQLKSNLNQHSIFLPFFLITILIIPIFIAELIPLNLIFIEFLIPITSLLLRFIAIILKIDRVIFLKHFNFEFIHFTKYFISNH